MTAEEYKILQGIVCDPEAKCGHPNCRLYVGLEKKLPKFSTEIKKQVFIVFRDMLLEERVRIFKEHEEVVGLRMKKLLSKRFSEFIESLI